MQTLRKLPSSKPNSPKKTQGSIGKDHSNSRGILKPIVYIVDMSSEKLPAVDPQRFSVEAVGIMARLRGPGGCPGDCEQSFDTIRNQTLEENAMRCSTPSSGATGPTFARSWAIFCYK